MSKESNLKLSESQSKMLSNAIFLVSASVVVIFFVFIFHGLIYFISKFSSVLLPPVVAVILAMIFKPYYFWLYKKLWRNKILAIIGVFASVLLPLMIFLYAFGVLLVEEFVKLIVAFPTYLNDALMYLKKMAPSFMGFIEGVGLDKYLKNMDLSKAVDVKIIASKIGGATISFGSVIFEFLGEFFSWLVLPVYVAIFLSSRPYNGKDVSKAMIFLSPKARENISYLIDQFLSIVVVYFRAQVLVALIQGVLFAVLFHFLGLKYGLVIGVVLGLLNIVPYLGNILGWIIIIPLSLFGSGGGVWLLIKIIIAFCVVQTLDSFFITPRIMKNRTGLNTFTIIFSLFFWSNVIGGALGMLLAIPLSAFVAVLWRLVKREYFSNNLSNSEEQSSDGTQKSIEIE